MNEKIGKPPIEKLESIADHHISPPPHHIVDIKVQYYDMKKLLPYVKIDPVLELGYGDGMWTSEIINKFGHTNIIDASLKLLTRAKEIFGNKVTTYCSYFEDFFPPESVKFGTIIASHILEHVADPVFVLKRIKEWLKPEGIIIAIVPNARSYHRQLSVLMNIQKTIYDFSPADKEVGHLRVYDLDSFKRDTIEAGLKIIHERGLFLKVLPNSMMTGFSDDLIEALVDISDNLPANEMANIALILKNENDKIS